MERGGIRDWKIEKRENAPSFFSNNVVFFFKWKRPLVLLSDGFFFFFSNNLKNYTNASRSISPACQTHPRSGRSADRNTLPPLPFIRAWVRAGIAGTPVGHELRRGSASTVAWEWTCLIDPRSPLLTVEPPNRRSWLAAASSAPSAAEGLHPPRWMSSRDEANNGEGEGWNFDRAAERHGFSDHR